MQDQTAKILSKNTYLFYRKKEEEHEMDKKKMKDEAARRMKVLELYDFPARSIIRAFMNDDAVFVSLPAKGNRIAKLHPLTDAEKKMVKNFEEEHSAIAYHVIRNEIETGITYSTIYSILYVSDKEKEWETECNGFKDFSSAYIAYPMVYTWDTSRNWQLLCHYSYCWLWWVMQTRITEYYDKRKRGYI